MANQPRTLVGQTLTRLGIQNGPVNHIMSMSCLDSDSDSSSVSLSEPNPLKCQVPLERVSPQCRDYCRRAMSEQAIQCRANCRKYILMKTQSGETYRGFATLVRYLLDPTGQLARVTLLIPLISPMTDKMRSWTFIGRDPPASLHDYWRTHRSPNDLECFIEDLTFSPIDLPRLDSVPGYRADAFWSIWEPHGKHTNVFGELNLFLHLGAKVSMHLSIPRGVAVREPREPRTRVQREFALAGDQQMASRHPLVPLSIRWPDPVAAPRQSRPAPRVPREPPFLNDIRTRSEVYEGVGPATRRRRTQ